jgi:hypothetical protein
MYPRTSTAINREETRRDRDLCGQLTPSRALRVLWSTATAISAGIKRNVSSDWRGRCREEGEGQGARRHLAGVGERRERRLGFSRDGVDLYPSRAFWASVGITHYWAGRL